MTLTKLAIDLLGCIFEVYLAILFFKTFWLMKSQKKRFFVICYCGASALVLTATSFFQNRALLIVAFLLIFFLLGFYFESTILAKVLIILLFAAIVLVSEIVIGVLEIGVLGESILSIQEKMTAYLFGTIGSKLLTLSVIYLFRLFSRPYDNQISSKWFNLSMLLLPLQSLLLCFMLHSVVMKADDSFIVLLSMLALFFSIILIFLTMFIINHQLKSMWYKHQYESSEQRLRSQVEYYNDLHKAQQEIRSIRHDMKQKLIAYLGLLESGKADEAVKNIRETVSLVHATESASEIGLPSVDAVLNTIIKKAGDCGIAIRHKILIGGELYIDQFELSLLLSNALENALEAVIKSTGIDTDIQLRISEKPGYLHVCVENYTSEKINDNLMTTKADKVNHGFGIRNMKNIVSKYDGSFQTDFNQGNGKFSLNMLLKNHAL